MHNSFIGCYHSVGFFKISLYKVGVLYILAWFRVGLRFEHHPDDKANLFS